MALHTEITAKQMVLHLYDVKYARKCEHQTRMTGAGPQHGHITAPSAPLTDVRSQEDLSRGGFFSFVLFRFHTYAWAQVRIFEGLRLMLGILSCSV